MDKKIMYWFCYRNHPREGPRSPIDWQNTMLPNDLLPEFRIKTLEQGRNDSTSKVVRVTSAILLNSEGSYSGLSLLLDGKANEKFVTKMLLVISKTSLIQQFIPSNDHE